MANKRLIDANALKDDFRRYMADRYDRERCVSEENCITCGRVCLFQRTINNAPTVDAVEVVHGGCDWCNGDYHTKIMATAIRYHSNGNMDGYEMKVNYCPNCGAKMDGGNEDG